MSFKLDFQQPDLPSKFSSVLSFHFPFYSAFSSQTERRLLELALQIAWPMISIEFLNVFNQFW